MTWHQQNRQLIVYSQKKTDKTRNLKPQRKYTTSNPKPIKKKGIIKNGTFKKVVRPHTTYQLEFLTTLYTQPRNGKTPNFISKPSIKKP